jgi:hypothetical protein
LVDFGTKGLIKVSKESIPVVRMMWALVAVVLIILMFLMAMIDPNIE